MNLTRKNKLTATLSKSVIAGSCSALLLLGAAGAVAEHHEDGAVVGQMNEQSAMDKAEHSAAEAKEDIKDAKDKVADSTSETNVDQQSMDGAKTSVAEAKEDIAEAREDVSEASEDVAKEKQDLAQEREQLAKTQDQHQQAMAEEMPTVQRTANSIIGKKIQNGAGDEVGVVTDIGVDWQNAKVPFVVVTSGGVLGVGGDMYKVPLDSLSASPDNEHFTMEITEKDLRSEFSKFEPLSERNEQQ